MSESVEILPRSTSSAHTHNVRLARVLVVEDEQFTRTMLGTSLQALGFEIAGLCDSAACALESQKAGRVDVALLDLDLGPGPSGIDIAYALRDAAATVGLVFLTSYRDPRIKDPDERGLPKGSRFLVKSQVVDPELIRSTIVDAHRDPLRAAARRMEVDELTDHQIAVLRLVASGRSNSEIAAAMDVSDKAVERTIQRISEALGLEASAGNRRVHLTRAYAELSGKDLPST